VTTPAMTALAADGGLIPARPLAAQAHALRAAAAAPSCWPRRPFDAW
jgi:hypothetical protein